jgi:hypothetical protein
MFNRYGIALAGLCLVLSACDGGGLFFGTKQLGSAGHRTYSHSTATDASGNVYVAGYTTGGLDGNTQIGFWDTFLTKYDASGNKLYTRQLGVAVGSTGGRSTATDASGNVYLAGGTQGGLDGNTLTGGGTDAFLTKYDASGNKLYTRQWGVAGADTAGFSAATDASGNVYVAGWTDGGLDGNTLIGLSDVFLIKYDANGDRL